MTDRLPEMGEQVRVNDSTDGRRGRVAGYGFQQAIDGTTTPVVLVRLEQADAGWASIGWDNMVPSTTDPAAISVGMLVVHPDNIFRVEPAVQS